MAMKMAYKQGLLATYQPGTSKWPPKRSRSLARFTAKLDLLASLLSEVGRVPKPFFFQEFFLG